MFVPETRVTPNPINTRKASPLNDNETDAVFMVQIFFSSDPAHPTADSCCCVWVDRRAMAHGVACRTINR